MNFSLVGTLRIITIKPGPLTSRNSCKASQGFVGPRNFVKLGLVADHFFGPEK
jgi:hypothetical protein